MEKRSTTDLAVARRIEADALAACKKNGTKFTDREFPADDTSLYRRDARLITNEWKRLSELTRTPSLFVDGVGSGDIVQGELGDCWFLGAMSVVATRNDLLYPLFVSAHPEVGFYQIRFFLDHKWRIVTIDDWVPIKFSQIRFAKCADKDELWVPLMEKAFAKLNGCYEHCASGNFSEGMTNLTGEGCETFTLTPSMAREDVFWRKLEYFVAEAFLMGCSVGHGGSENDAGNGLLTQHAYGILRCATTKTGVRLVQLRNPWGMKEWNGRWSDNSREWTPALMSDLQHTNADDGTFWMCYEDFLANFTEFAVCRLLTDSIGKVWCKYEAHSEWTRQTAGGCGNTPNWRLNPQFWVSVKKPTRVFFHLAQQDHRCEGRSVLEYASIGLYLFRADDISKQKETRQGGDSLHTPTFINSREYSYSMDPIEAGTYILMPCSFDPGFVARFYLTVYSEDEVVQFGRIGHGAYPKTRIELHDIGKLDWLNRAVSPRKGGVSPRPSALAVSPRRGGELSPRRRADPYPVEPLPPAHKSVESVVTRQLALPRAGPPEVRVLEADDPAVEAGIDSMSETVDQILRLLRAVQRSYDQTRFDTAIQLMKGLNAEYTKLNEAASAAPNRAKLVDLDHRIKLCVKLVREIKSGAVAAPSSPAPVVVEKTHTPTTTRVVGVKTVVTPARGSVVNANTNTNNALHSLSVNDVVARLTALHVANVDLFRRENIDGIALSRLSEADLKDELHLSLGDRKKVLLMVEELSKK